MSDMQDFNDIRYPDPTCPECGAPIHTGPAEGTDNLDFDRAAVLREFIEGLTDDQVDEIHCVDSRAELRAALLRAAGVREP